MLNLWQQKSTRTEPLTPFSQLGLQLTAINAKKLAIFARCRIRLTGQIHSKVIGSDIDIYSLVSVGMRKGGKNSSCVRKLWSSITWKSAVFQCKEQSSCHLLALQQPKATKQDMFAVGTTWTTAICFQMKTANCWLSGKLSHGRDRHTCKLQVFPYHETRSWEWERFTQHFSHLLMPEITNWFEACKVSIETIISQQPDLFCLLAGAGLTSFNTTYKDELNLQ